VFRFQFPERPGALLKFLEGLNDAWNISLFHYRNHGSDYARVLVGVEVPEDTASDFYAHLEAIGFPYWDETENPAYRQFLDTN
jgi:threonine dehydratase